MFCRVVYFDWFWVRIGCVVACFILLLVYLLGVLFLWVLCLMIVLIMIDLCCLFVVGLVWF